MTVGEAGSVWTLGTAEFRDGAGNRAEVTDERNYKYNILRHGKGVKSNGGKGIC